MDQDERHRIFKEELYPHASLPRLEFEVKLSNFLDKYPEIAKEDRPKSQPDINQFKKFLRENRSYF